MVEEYMRQLRGKQVWWNPRETWQPHHLGTDVSRALEDLDRAGISIACLLGQYWGPWDTVTPPEYVADVVRRHPTRFIGFHGGDPIGTEVALRALEHSVKELGFRGLKLSPAYNGLSLDDPRTLPMYAKAEELDVPVLVHTGWTFVPGSRVAVQNPLLLDEVAETFPQLRLIMGHTGFQWAHETLLLMRKHPNLYGDLAFWDPLLPKHFIADVLVWAKKLGVLGRILWGSDYPSSDPAAGVAFYRTLPAYTQAQGLDPALTEDDISDVLGRNAMRLFELG